MCARLISPGRADRVMRRAERPLGHQPRVGCQRARRAVDARHLQRFLQRHIRQNPRQAARHHRLAAARRADHQHVVAARRRDFQRALRALLAAHIREIAQDFLFAQQLGVGPGAQRLDPPPAAQMVDCLAQVRDRQNVQPLDAGGLRRVGRGQHDRAQAAFLRRDGHRQRPAHAHHPAGERQLADRRHARHRLRVQPPHRRENRQRNGQVVGRPLLAHIRRGEVERQPRDGEGRMTGGHRRAHPFPALLHRRIRQADNFKHRHAVHTICLHRHRVTLYARQSHTLNTCKHGKHFHFVLLYLQKVYHTHPAQASGKGKPPPKIIFSGRRARSSRAHIRPLFIFARPIGCKSVNRGV